MDAAIVSMAQTGMPRGISGNVWFSPNHTFCINGSTTDVMYRVSAWEALSMIEKTFKACETTQSTLAVPPHFALRLHPYDFPISRCIGEGQQGYPQQTTGTKYKDGTCLLDRRHVIGIQTTAEHRFNARQKHVVQLLNPL
jgi:hypothetical protein